MIVKELAQEVVSDGIVSAALGIESLFDEFKILFIMFFAKGYTQEGLKSLGDIIREPLAVKERDDVVFVSFEGWGRNLL